MARKKEPPKPLFGLKHDFYDSLDNVAQRGINLIQAAEFALQHGNLPQPIADQLREQVTAFRASLMSDD